MSDFEKDEFEIEQLFKDIDLEPEDLGFGNHDNAPFPESQVPLFPNVGSPTETSGDEVPPITLLER